MGQEILVKENISAAGRAVLELQSHFSVKSAFLAVIEGSDNPMLYVVLDDMTEEDKVYRAVLRFARECPDPNFDPFSITVVGTEDPMAQAALDFTAKHGSVFSTTTSGRYFGQAGIERVYIFASPLNLSHIA
jgi:hypothetical protein